MTKVLGPIVAVWMFAKEFYEHHHFLGVCIVTIPAVLGGATAWLQDSGALGAVLVGLVILSAIAFGMNQLSIYRARSSTTTPLSTLPPKNAGSITANLDQRMPLHEAARLVLEAAELTPAGQHAIGFNEDSIIKWCAEWILRDANNRASLYGRRTESSNVLLIEDYQPGWITEDARSLQPPCAHITHTDLQVIRSDLDEAIKRLVNAPPDFFNR